MALALFSSALPAALLARMISNLFRAHHTQRTGGSFRPSGGGAVALALALLFRPDYTHAARLASWQCALCSSDGRLFPSVPGKRSSAGSSLLSSPALLYLCVSFGFSSELTTHRLWAVIPARPGKGCVSESLFLSPSGRTTHAFRVASLQSSPHSRDGRFFPSVLQLVQAVVPVHKTNLLQIGPWCQGPSGSCVSFPVCLYPSS